MQGRETGVVNMYYDSSIHTYLLLLHIRYLCKAVPFGQREGLSFKQLGLEGRSSNGRL